MNTPSTQTIREWIDSMPEGEDRFRDLIIHDRQMYRVTIERMDADQIVDSVRDFVLKINLGK
jgi:hypothetical protein